MATEEEKLKVSHCLRLGVDETECMNDHHFLRWLHEIVGQSDDGRILTRLADLIETETCRIEQISVTQMKCSKCGEVYEWMEVTSLSDSILEYEGNYCRGCGRKVVKQ